MKMRWRQTWARLQPRERRLIALAAAVVALGLVWALALAPALAVLRAAPAQRAALQASLVRLQAQRAQALALQAGPTLDAPAARRALESATRALGPAAELKWQGPRARIEFKGVEPAALARWLAALRDDVRLAPAELHLQRAAASVSASAQPANAASAPRTPASAALRWQGWVALDWPAEGAP